MYTVTRCKRAVVNSSLATVLQFHKQQFHFRFLPATFCELDYEWCNPCPLIDKTLRVFLVPFELCCELLYPQQKQIET
jgi:hypothetical protein